MAHVPEPAGVAGPAVQYPPLPPGYSILDDATLMALSARVEAAEREVARLSLVLEYVPVEVRVKAEDDAAKNKTHLTQSLVIHWACFDRTHRHESELEAQGCIDKEVGLSPVGG